MSRENTPDNLSRGMFGAFSNELERLQKEATVKFFPRNSNILSNSVLNLGRRWLAMRKLPRIRLPKL